MGITASLCAFILLYDSRKSALYKRAQSCTEIILKKAASTGEFGEMGAAAVWMLLGDLMQCGLYASFACDGLMERITEAVNGSIERNQEKWEFIPRRPSEFIWSPDSPLYKGNEDIVKKELDYLIETRNQNGYGISPGAGTILWKSMQKNLPSVKTGGWHLKQSITLVF